VELAQAQYRAGLSDSWTVVDSQRVVAALDDELAQSQAQVTACALALCKSVGGGFESEERVGPRAER